MAWTFEYNLPVGRRVNRYFSSVTTFKGNHAYSPWYVEDENKWLDDKDIPKGLAFSTHHNAWQGAPKTFKAFKRYLSKHPELKGLEVVLVNRYGTGRRNEPITITATWNED